MKKIKVEVSSAPFNITNSFLHIHHAITKQTKPVLTIPPTLIQSPSNNPTPTSSTMRLRLNSSLDAQRFTLQFILYSRSNSQTVHYDLIIATSHSAQFDARGRMYFSFCDRQDNLCKTAASTRVTAESETDL